MDTIKWVGIGLIVANISFFITGIKVDQLMREMHYVKRDIEDLEFDVQMFKEQLKSSES